MPKKLRLLEDCPLGRRGALVEVELDSEARKLCRRGIAYPYIDELQGRQVPYFAEELKAERKAAKQKAQKPERETAELAPEKETADEVEPKKGGKKK